MKYKGTFEDLKGKGFILNFFKEYYFRTETDGQEWATIFIDKDTKLITFEGNNIRLGQNILDEIEVEE